MPSLSELIGSGGGGSDNHATNGAGDIVIDEDGDEVMVGGREDRDETLAGQAPAPLPSAGGLAALLAGVATARQSPPRPEDASGAAGGELAAPLAETSPARGDGAAPGAVASIFADETPRPGSSGSPQDPLGSAPAAAPAGPGGGGAVPPEGTAPGPAPGVS